MTPAKYWLTAAKAAESQATLFSNAREYEDAIKLLKDVSTEITRKVVEYYLPAERVDKDKTLQDNLYSFTVRKILA